MFTVLSKKFSPVIILAIFILSMSIIQFASPDLPDNDGFYHIKLAYLMRTEGLKPDFIWLPESILSAEEYYDHHFLFHVALIPFTFGNLLLGAKWAAVIFSSFAFMGIWYLFHRQQVPYAGLWALGLLVLSDSFLYRMSVARAQSLSLLALALGFAWLLQGKHKHLAVLAYIYVWLYDAFPLLVVLAVLHMLAVLLTEHRLVWRPLAFIAAGVILGLVVNPYFPDNILFTFRHIFPKLADATSVSVGNEWYPYDTLQLLENSLPALVAFASGILALGITNRKMDAPTALAMLASLLFGLMLFQARRFIEYFAPFTLIFAAFAWSQFFAEHIAAGKILPVPGFAHSAAPKSRFWSLPVVHLPAVLLLVAVLLGGFRTLPAARERMLNLKPFNLYASAAGWLQQNTSPGELIFQTDWDDFPRLFFYNTHNTYLLGLDPTYLQLHDAEMYDLWSLIVSGDVQRPSQFIQGVFKSRFVHTDVKHTGFLRQAAQDPDLQEVYRDDQAVIFQVTRP